MTKPQIDKAGLILHIIDMSENQYFENPRIQDPEDIYTTPLSAAPKAPGSIQYSNQRESNVNLGGRSNSTSNSSKIKKNPFWTLAWYFVVLALSFAIVATLMIASKQPDFQANFGKYFNFNSIFDKKTQTTSQAPKTNIQFASQAQAKTTVEVVSKNLPSVISINVQAKDNPIAVAGTGYIVSPDGLVITNKHVVALGCRYGQKGIQITALANDQKAYNAELLSVDPIDDIAILRLKDKKQNPTGLSTVEFGDSTVLQLGEEVIAIGNALGTFQNSVTKGVVSGLNRSFLADGLKDECTGTEVRTDGLVQTDAAINQGNSGGPLFSASGQFVAMNTLGSPDAQNVGLAIPSETILTVLNSYKANQAISRPRLGVVSQEINAARKLENPWLPVDYGEFVGSFDVAIPTDKVVAIGSAAEQAGLGLGDIILEVDGVRLESTSSNPNPLRRLILNQQPGQTISLTVLKSTITKSSKQLQYAQDTVVIKATLKGLTFDIPTGKLINSDK